MVSVCSSRARDRAAGRRDPHRQHGEDEAQRRPRPGGDTEADVHEQRRDDRPDPEEHVEDVHRPPAAGSELPHQHRVGAEIGARPTQADHDEADEQSGAGVEHRHHREAGGEDEQGEREHAVTVEPVVQPASEHGAGDVAEALTGEQHADRTDARARPLTQLGERRPEHAQRPADDEEADEVEADRCRPRGGGRDGRCGGHGAVQLNARRRTQRRSHRPGEVPARRPMRSPSPRSRRRTAGGPCRRGRRGTRPARSTRSSVGGPRTRRHRCGSGTRTTASLLSLRRVRVVSDQSRPPSRQVDVSRRVTRLV